MIWIRADGGQEMGVGHIMRCLSVALEIEKNGEDVCFVLADENASELIARRGIKVLVLHTDYRKMEAELAKLLPLLEEQKPSAILVDSYFVTAEYIQTLRKFAKVAYLDDMCQLDCPVDLLINYNIFADEEDYKPEALALGNIAFGPEYAPLRSEFSEVEYTVRDEAEAVLITTGGSDKYNLAGKLLQAAMSSAKGSVERATNLQYYVVSGAYNPNLPYLQEMSRQYDNIHICVNVSNMSELMVKCDMALTAGGSTMYELSAVGVPMLCFSFVDNQERIVQGFAKQELVAFAGDYLNQGEAMPEAAIVALNQLAENLEERQRLSFSARKLVDGRGAARIAERLCQL